MTHSATPRVTLFCSYHILTSSVIYYWTDGRQHGIYLLNNSPKWGWIVVDICRAAKRRGKYPPLSPTVVHLERWTDFFQTFPVGSNRSIQFQTGNLVEWIASYVSKGFSLYGVNNFLSKWRQRASLQVKFLACSTVDFPQQISRDWQVAPPTVRKKIRHYQRYGTFSAFSHGGSEPCKVTAQCIEILSFKTNMVIGFNIQIINRSIICILETASGLHVQIINLLLHSWNDYRAQCSNNQFIN